MNDLYLLVCWVNSLCYGQFVVMLVSFIPRYLVHRRRNLLVLLTTAPQSEERMRFTLVVDGPYGVCHLQAKHNLLLNEYSNSIWCMYCTDLYKSGPSQPDNIIDSRYVTYKLESNTVHPHYEHTSGMH